MKERGVRWLSGCVALAAALSGCAKESGGQGPQSPKPAAWGLPAQRGQALPSGAACTSRLRASGVRFERLKRRGVADAVRITGPIGGIRFLRGRKLETVADCRLGLALLEVARVLKRWGAYEVQHYGAYSYRNTRSGRLSLHARGLAIDIRTVRFRQAGNRKPFVQSVKEHFVRGLGNGCDPRAPALNQLGCQVRDLRLFVEVITPDHDRDHHDHFHLALPR